MQRILLTLLIFAAGFGLSAQVVLEDFEGGMADLPWNAFEGTYDGAVMNPVDSTSNTSEWVGRYTKAGDRAYSYFVAQLSQPLDLSTNNQYSIQIYAGAATQLLMKLEGGGESIEKIVNIPTANAWRTYTFDFSAAAGFTGITDIILFFDPGVETSADTYLFDNLIASPAGPCAGTVADPTIIDDFECQRNASYGVGFDDLEVIANPDKSGINTSDSVARYTDQEGAFHALVIDYNNFIDLSTNNYVCIKVWAPVAGDVLFKVQDGLRPDFENRVAITETNTWVEVCQDFSAQAGGRYNKLVLFFNAGVADAEGDIYYLDDITITPAPIPEALEDFEDGANLAWMPLNGDNTLHGTFNGAIANPDATGINTSSMVGSYTRGNSMFSALTAVLPNGLDLSSSPQLNLDVWAPDGASSVTLQLQSATEGAKTATASIDATMTWQTLSFNFESFQNITDFEQVNILFDPQTAGNGVYYFDNLNQGQSTVDACADVEPDPAILDDFECQRNAEYTCCDVTVTPVPNPDPTTANPSERVGEVTDPAGAFNALVIDNGEEFDLSLRNQLSAQIWAPVAGQILFKLEGDGVEAQEIFQDIPSLMEWNTYTVDLSPYEGMGYSRLVLFFGAGTDNATANTYYIDDIRLGRPAYTTSCVATFESVNYSLTEGFYFENGAFTDNGVVIVENPDQTGINTSSMVGEFSEAADGTQPWAGLAMPLDAPIQLVSGAKTVTMKVWMPVAGTVVFKLEAPRDGAPPSNDVLAEYTTPGEWQELTYDMSFLPDGAMYDQITILMNSGVIPEMNLVHYYDDIAVGGGDCSTVDGIFNPVVLDELRVYPNPVNEQLTIEIPNGATRFTLTNLLGQQVKQLNVDRAQTQVQWEVSDLPRATYVLTAQDQTGRLVARSMIVKQ